jgi:hypothetical protein
MPTISENLLPTIAPGSLLQRFTTDESINIRWLTAQDPVYFEALNRPLADIALRQLILAKTLDNISLRLGHQALFPFLIQPYLVSGSYTTGLPLSWIWDMQVSLPAKWQNLRLAKIKRISGANNVGSAGSSYTGALRLVFTAVEAGSTLEVALFQADYEINSALTYQIMPIMHLVQGEEPVILPVGELSTIAGYLTFRTLDQSDPVVQAMFNAVPPPIGVPTNSAGEYVTPTVVAILDSAPSNVSANSFSQLAVSHGTGLLTLSAWNPIPAINSDIATWVQAFNYPFDANATLQSATVPGLVIPRGLFKEFNLVAPASDNPTGDQTGNFFPVYISRIERNDVSADSITMYFSTFNEETPSIVPVEFAQLVLHNTFTPNQIVAITQAHHLFPSHDTDPNWFQGFGKGHVMLSDFWGTATVNDFFALFAPLVNDPPEALFVFPSTRVSSYGLSRASTYTPTAGQAAALRGSKDTIAYPSATNRYVVEADQGLGTQVDFATNTSLPPNKRENPDIERFGYTGCLAHKIFSLIVDASGPNHDYDMDVLPRIKILLGRPPMFGDQWWDGTRLKFFNGDAWVG